LTIIAYKNGIMAADTWITSGGTFCGETCKIKKNQHGLWGSAGDLSDMVKFLLWADNPEVDAFDLMHFGNFSGIHVDYNGRVYYYDDKSSGIPASVSVKYAAEGSGRNHALGALEVGASAVESVKACAKLDVSVGGWVESVSLEGGGVVRERLEK
jgi:hypothetical protein